MKLKGAWTYVGSSTYEAITSDRIHILGTIKVGGKILSTCSSFEMVKLKYLCFRIMGGNEKRALMLMCEKLSGDGYNNLISQYREQ